MDPSKVSPKTTCNGSRKRKKDSCKRINSKLFKLDTDEKFLLSDIPEADFEKCLIKMEREEEDKSYCFIDDSSQPDPVPGTSSETTLVSFDPVFARTMSEALVTLIRSDRLSRDPLENVDNAEGISGLPGPSSSSSPIPTPDISPPPSTNPATSASPTPANSDVDAADQASNFPFTETKIKLEGKTPVEFFSPITIAAVLPHPPPTNTEPSASPTPVKLDFDAPDQASNFLYEESKIKLERNPSADNLTPIPTPAVAPSHPTNPASSAAPTPAKQNVDGPERTSNFPIVGSAGLKIKLESNTPTDYFSLLFSDAFFQFLIRETNEFAATLLTGKVHPRARISEWKKVTVDEMKKFLGLVFHSGIIKISRWSDFWSRDELFRIPIFANTMGRDRFLLILSALHFAKIPDPDHSPPTNLSPIHELLPLLEHFHDNMKYVTETGDILCIGESMAPWRGQLRSGRMTRKYGIKLYLLTEPDGLVHRFIIYAGAEDREAAGPGHASRVVKKLMSGFEGSGRSLFLDSFFKSIDLTEELLSKNIHVTSSLLANRKHNVVDVANCKSKKGDLIQRWSDGDINVAMRDGQREGLAISSESSDNLVTTSNRRVGRRVGGTEGCDQLLGDYIAPRKSMNWFKKLGLHIMEIMLLNSYKLYHRYSGDDRTDFYNFRKSIIKFLVGPEPQRPPKPAPRLSRGVSDWYINSLHFPSTMEGSSNAKNPRRKMTKGCRQCSKMGRNKKVSTYCPGCDNLPGLCLSCFIPWHLEVRGFKDVNVIVNNNKSL